MVVQRAAVTMMIPLLLLAGCRRETPMERSAREYRARRARRLEAVHAQTPLTQAMPDDQIVRASPSEGLGLGLRVEKMELHTGEPLQAEVIYANLGAEVPVAAATCQAFTLSSEDEETLVSKTITLPAACADGDAAVQLPPGAVRTMRVNTAGTRLVYDHPGTFIVAASWQPLRSRDRTPAHKDDDASVVSNPVMITVR